MLTRATSLASACALALTLSLLPACSSSKSNTASSQAKTQPPQTTAPSVVEQPDSTGPILSNDSTAMTGNEVEAAQEGPLHRVHFGYDDSNLNSEAQGIMGGNASYLSQHPSTFIRIEGHCDERGSVEYNQALGERRANSAKQFLASQGIDGGRMETISFGEDRPLSFEHTEYGWALNRRAEFRILSE